MPAAKVVVNLPGGTSFDVRVGAGILEGIGARVTAALPQATEAYLLTDTNVGPLYASAVSADLSAAGLSVTEISVPSGEAGRSLACATEILNALAANGAGEQTIIVALGGATVANVAGFAAATYADGLPIVMAPTSLYAVVETSVACRARVELGQADAFAGVPVCPTYVCADTTTLRTLPDDAWETGMAEVERCATFDPDAEGFAAWLEELADDFAARDPEAVQEAAAYCIASKVNAAAAAGLGPFAAAAPGARA